MQIHCSTTQLFEHPQAAIAQRDLCAKSNTVFSRHEKIKPRKVLASPPETRSAILERATMKTFSTLDVVFLLALGALTTGCATTETQTASEDPLVRPGAVIELGTVGISADKPYEIDAADLMRDALVEALTERDIFWLGEPEADRFRLDVIVDDYEPGDAFKRWLLPGFGATIIQVSGKLTDLSTGEVVSEIDHERGVYWGGGYTIGAWKSIFKTVADDIATELENRIENKGFVVRLQPWPSRDVDIPAAAVSQTFAFADVSDSRQTRGRIGERTAAFEVSMGDVFFYRKVPAFMQEAVGAELFAAGHKLANDGSGRPVSLNVVTFWTHTITTALYWDIFANMEIAVTVGAGEPDQADGRATFNCETTKRTYVWPSLELVSDVMDQCLIELMGKVRADPVWEAR
jgi:hypothetical protein